MQTRKNDPKGGWYSHVLGEIFILNSETKIKRVLKDESGKERIDMCKALRDLYEEGVEQGIKDLIMKKYRKGISVEEIADFVEMPFEKVRGIVEDSSS